MMNIARLEARLSASAARCGAVLILIAGMVTHSGSVAAQATSLPHQQSFAIFSLSGGVEILDAVSDDKITWHLSNGDRFHSDLTTSAMIAYEAAAGEGQWITLFAASPTDLAGAPGTRWSPTALTFGAFPFEGVCDAELVDADGYYQAVCVPRDGDPYGTKTLMVRRHFVTGDWAFLYHNVDTGKAEWWGFVEVFPDGK